MTAHLRTASLRARFADLHRSGLFAMPNAWDLGSAHRLTGHGFPAVATTSSGLAAALGRADQTVSLDELLAHAEALAAAVDVPLSVDSERCYGAHPDGVAQAVAQIAATGAAGCSIEDYDPAAGVIDPPAEAEARVSAAADAAHAAGMTLTARCEHNLYGIDDLDATIARLIAYGRAGADVLYAPGLTTIAAITRVVAEVGRPVNVLLLPDGPPLPDLAAAGVRRVSTGGALARAAYATLDADAARLAAALPDDHDSQARIDR